MRPIEFELPLRIESLNVGQRTSIDPGHMLRRRFAVRGKVKKHRHAAHLALLAQTSPAQRRQLLAAERLVITLTRLAPGTLDREDNLTAGFKAARDGLADALKLDDRDPRLRWQYEQRRQPAYAMQVRLEAMSSRDFAGQLYIAEIASQ